MRPIAIPMIKLCTLLLSICTVALPCLGQVVPAGYRNLEFVNPTPKGSPIIPARVYYPATSAGPATPIVPRPGGYPVVVFMHGYGNLGSNYTALGTYLSQRGFVVVLGDTASIDETLQLEDNRALFWALAAANDNPSHRLYGALDMQNVGISGHSMGGRNSFRMFIYNPGYTAALAIAPAYAGSLVMPLVDVPLGVIHGEGDLVVPWSIEGHRCYLEATKFKQFKLFYLFDSTADHHNLIGMQRQQPLQPIWEISANVIAHFFDRTLKGQHSALEPVLGPTARRGIRLTQIDAEVATPEMWFAPEGKLGQTSTFSVLAEPGPASLFAATATASVMTPFGLLQLDPSTVVAIAQGVIGQDRLMSFSLTVPNVPALQGISIPFQGLGKTNTDQHAWTNLSEFVIR